jgi:hypothetical protein
MTQTRERPAKNLLFPTHSSGIRSEEGDASVTLRLNASLISLREFSCVPNTANSEMDFALTEF